MNSFQSFRVQRPEYHVSNMAPEIGKHSTGVIQEVAVSKVATLRHVFGIRSRAQPHVPIEGGRRRFDLCRPQVRRRTGFPETNRMNFSKCPGADDLHYTMVILAGMY